MNQEIEYCEYCEGMGEYWAYTTLDDEQRVECEACNGTGIKDQTKETTQ